MDEPALKLEMRLTAIEYLLAKIHLMTILAHGVRPTAFNQFAESFVEEARNQKFRVTDPAISDLLSAEWGEAIERLIIFEKEILAQQLQK
jgi:hypothetical protein